MSRNILHERLRFERELIAVHLLSNETRLLKAGALSIGRILLHVFGFSLFNVLLLSSHQTRSYKTHRFAAVLPVGGLWVTRWLVLLLLQLAVFILDDAHISSARLERVHLTCLLLLAATVGRSVRAR